MVFHKKIQISKLVYAVSILSGTIIGVGFFSLPYITLKTNIWLMLGYFLVLGALVIIIHLFFGELVLKAPDFKRLPGLAKIYLGKWGKRAAVFSTILGLFGAMLAYLIVGGEFLESLFSPIIGGNNIHYTILYFLAGAFLIYFGTKAVSRIEFWGLILFLAVLILIFFKGRGLIDAGNLFLTSGNWRLNWFLPYGPILFSLWGAALIPEMEEMLGKDKRLLKIIIPISILIPILIYFFFIFLILGITGSRTTESALTGLRSLMGNGIVSFGLFFGVLTTFTSFIALGLTLKKVFWYDLKTGENRAFFISCFIPLILFFIGIKKFILIISFVGGITLGIDGILILLMYRKINPKNFLVYPLLLILLGGIVYEIIYFLE